MQSTPKITRFSAHGAQNSIMIVLFIYLFYHSGIVTFNYDCALLKSQTVSMWNWLINRMKRTNNKYESILVTTKTYLNCFWNGQFWMKFVVVVVVAVVVCRCKIPTQSESSSLLAAAAFVVVVGIHLWCHSLNISRWFQFQLIQTTTRHAISRFYLLFYACYFYTL